MSMKERNYVRDDNNPNDNINNHRSNKNNNKNYQIRNVKSLTNPFSIEFHT